MRGVIASLFAVGVAVASTAPAQQTLCPGDCAVDGIVAVSDLLLMVNVINGERPPGDCVAGDSDGDGRLRAHEVTRAVRSALDGCSNAAIGQAAFYRALNGVPDGAAAQAAEEERALARLQAAAAEHRDDGWSHFLLGMLHLLRVGRALTDYANPSEFVITESRLAREALDAAVPLLPYDDRIPGFRGAATYNLGFVTGDPILEQLGVAQLQDAVAENLLFNSFSYLGTVAPTVRRDDPRFALAIEYLDAGIQSGCTPVSDPRNCGNGGRASHNIQGSFTLFADLYLKAGRPQDARNWLQLALALPGQETWRHRYLVEERLADFDARAARFADDDPANDPPIVGAGPEACVHCHFR